METWAWCVKCKTISHSKPRDLRARLLTTWGGGAGGRAERKRECESAKCERDYLRPVFSRSVIVPFEQQQQQTRLDRCTGRTRLRVLILILEPSQPHERKPGNPIRGLRGASANLILTLEAPQGYGGYDGLTGLTVRKVTALARG